VETLLQKFGDKIKGVLTGFDRIVFKGGIRPILFAAGMQNFLAAHGVLNKHDKDWAVAQSAAIVTATGQPHPLAHPELLTRVTQWQDGMRIRHGVDRNSVKLYNEQNVVRVEQTMNNPGAYRVHRHQEGETAPTTKQRLPLRQGIADIPLRAQIMVAGAGFPKCYKLLRASV
jgi:hypothetical protein